MYKDMDEDGHGDPQATMTFCSVGEGNVQGYVGQPDDCDDDCDTCFGGAVEQCDGFDNDCDGVLDELDPEPCGSNIGICSAGLTYCTNGEWGSCEGGVSPAIRELCDQEDPKDDDCDGSIDETCDCMEGQRRTCGSSEVGACQLGTQVCEDGDWGTCHDAVEQQEETCDGLDNDCDGRIDEDLTRSCPEGSGVCVLGTQRCRSGAWSPCSGAVLAESEVCDRRDNDCDGVIDENVIRSCGVMTGRCRQGIETCTNGIFGACMGSVVPTAEVCDVDGVDEDCDGTENEDCTCANGQTRSCGFSDEGACRLGLQTCAGGSWGICQGALEPHQEVCDTQGLDEDCDGQSNEDCECVDGQTELCPDDLTELCSAGIRRCMDGRWGPCRGQVPAEREICDQLDNDCDLAIDEGGVCDDPPCASGDCGAYEPCRLPTDCSPPYRCNRLVGMCTSECTDSPEDDPTAPCRALPGFTNTCLLGEICALRCNDGTCPAGLRCYNNPEDRDHLLFGNLCIRPDLYPTSVNSGAAP